MSDQGAEDIVPPGNLGENRHDDPLKTRASLIDAVRDPRDMEAWGRFVDRYGPMILSWSRQWFPRSPQDAEDVAQEVFLKLASLMTTFRYDAGRGKFRSWLGELTRNLMKDMKRKAKRRMGEAPGGDRGLLDEEEARIDLEARWAAEFDLELMEVAEQRVRLRVKEANWMAYVEADRNGRRPSEVASELGIPVARVSQASFSVKAMIREEIAKLAGPGSD